MKVNRINVVINRLENKHVPNIDIPIMDIQRYYKFGGLSGKDTIELHNMPEQVTTVLDKLKIVYERMKK